MVDLDGDGDLEIVAGNDSGLLHVLHHDGTEMASYDVGDDIRGGISVADLNDDGSYELLFAGYDDMIHVWNPMDGVELDGWPVDMEYNSLTEPVTADLDNDGDLDIVTNEFNSRPMVLISNLAEKHEKLNYLKVKLVGKKSNRDGLGAVVRVSTDSQTYMKVHDGQSGYLSQSLYPLYFGLNEATHVDEIKVTWPSGNKQTVKGPININETIEVREQ